MIECILDDFARAYDFKCVSLRYFNAAGADPEGEIGEDHDPETHLIPLVLDIASGRRDHIEILGTDYDTAWRSYKNIFTPEGVTIFRKRQTPPEP